MENETVDKRREDALIEKEKDFRSLLYNLQALFDHMSNGFAYHRIVTDEADKPVDYIFLEINKAFEELTGLKRENLIGKRVTVALPGIEDDPFDWIGTYGEIAQTGQSRRFEQYSQPLDRWYSISAYSPAKDHFAVTIEEITQKKIAADKLKESLKEKEMLLKEIHHRVKNNMAVISSMLSLQADELGDSKVREIFSDIRQRIRAMSLVHEKLYQSGDLSKIDFSDYLRSLTGKLTAQFSTSSVTMEVLAKNISLGIDSAIPCGLIISELIVNAFKYAFPDGMKGKLFIQMQLKENGKYEITVSDDGVGLPEDFDWQKPPTFGLNLVHMLVEQLQGEISVTGNDGTRFRITFPAL